MPSPRMENLLSNSLNSTSRNKDVTIRKLRRDQKNLKHSVTELRSNLDSYKELHLRQIAEMENFLKAKEREMSAMSRNASRDVVRNLLPFIDSLDSAARSSGNNDGMVPLRNQMLKILSFYGFKEIESVGRKFDPYLHEAVGIVDSDEDNKVMEEVQKGYMLRDEVIRSAKVLVGRRK